MNKSEIVRNVSEGLMLTRRDAKELVDGVIDEIIISIVKEGKVVIPRLGTFKCVTLPKRKVRNPVLMKNKHLVGEVEEFIEVPDRKAVKFKPSMLLKKMIREQEIEDADLEDMEVEDQEVENEEVEDQEAEDQK